jgi:hypothetical protein
LKLHSCSAGRRIIPAPESSAIRGQLMIAVKAKVEELKNDYVFTETGMVIWT